MIKIIFAEKVNVDNKDWIKVSFKNNPLFVNEMKKVKGVRFNPKSRLWAVPYENKYDFERRMGNFLILWKGSDSFGTSGIAEESISNQPIIPGYSVTYDDEGNIINSTGFKQTPWGCFQVKGFNCLLEREFLILADDAGLGKSFMVATAIEARKKLGHLNRGLIICKASLIFNWRDEIMKHTYEEPIVVSGNLKERCKTYNSLVYSDNWTFLILSYEMFRTDIGAIALLNNQKQLDFCVLDEAHKVKNPQSRIGSVIHQIPFKYKYVLTATPLPNTPLEAYNYLRWGGKIHQNWWQFRNRYAIFGGYNNKEIIGYKNILELKNLIQNNMLRRLKKDKLKELPEVVFKTISLKLTTQQQILYNAVKQEILDDLKDTTLQSIPSALTKLLRLQQITDSPEIIGVSSKSAKFEALDDLLEELIDVGGEKVIVFSKFRTVVDILRKRYKQYNPAVIHGDVDASGRSYRSAKKYLKENYKGFLTLSKEQKEILIQETMTSERQKEVYKFQNDDSCKLFIGCSPACREGLTLTAATNVIFVDCEYSPAYVEQAYSRAHRIGQKNAVTVYYLVCEDTIDEYIQDMLNKKETMAQVMLDNGISEIGSDRARQVIASMIGEMVT